MITIPVVTAILYLPMRWVVGELYQARSGVYAFLITAIIVGILIAIFLFPHIGKKIFITSFVILLVYRGMAGHPNILAIIFALIVAVLVKVVILLYTDIKKWL